MSGLVCSEGTAKVHAPLVQRAAAIVGAIGLTSEVLLRTLQEGEVVPIGATQPIRIDVRVIACANRDLPTEVAEGRFRPDLYYRLNVFPLGLRPLRERADDIAPLAFALLLRHTPIGAPFRCCPKRRWRCSNCTAGRAMSASWKT